MRIVEIKQVSSERFTLCFDDGSELKTSLSVITERFLRSGLELDADEYSELVSASTLSLSKSRALRIINTRAMSEKELYKKLTEKGETPENSAICVDWLREMGLLDDLRYAQSCVRHYAAKGYGTGRVRQELRRHGIPAELWDEALEQMPAQDDKLERFIRARLSDPTDRAQVKRVSDALFRRGYSWDEIKHALNTFNAKAEDDY